MTELRSCGAILLREENGNQETLLVKHTSGHWGFPKGKKENNETEEETAIREVLEETGYQITIENGFREISSYLPEPGVHKQVTYFIGRIIGGEILSEGSEGIETAAWLPYSEALALLAHADDIRILRQVKKYLQQFEAEE